MKVAFHHYAICKFLLSIIYLEKFPFGLKYLHCSFLSTLTYFVLLTRYLNNNYFTGGIPAQLANLSSLEILWVFLLYRVLMCVSMVLLNIILLCQDLSSWKTPITCCLFVGDRYLSYNKMSGVIPSSVAHIPKLTYL